MRSSPGVGSDRRAVVALVAAASLLGGCGEEAPPGPAQPASHTQMLALLRDVAVQARDTHIYQGDRRARELRRELERLGASAPWRLYLDAAIAELGAGHERPGIALLAAAHQGLVDGSIPGDTDAFVAVAFYLGVGYMRLGETENCCRLPSVDSCIMPFQGGGLHQRPEGSTNALRHFGEVLEASEPGSYWHLAAQWLLNLAAMTLGDYPDGIPERYRIPAAAFESKIEFPRFVNIAADLGLDTFSLSGGVIADDFDGDGYLDLIVSTWDTEGQIRFWRNRRDGSFEDRTVVAGLTGLFGGLNLKQADYDNDGDLDFLVLRGSWVAEAGQHPNSLVRNNGDGTFSDVSIPAGLAEVHYPTQTAGWADYDNDGDLDLYIGNETSARIRAPCQLFRNDGDGTFTERAAAAGVANLGYAKAVTWGDYDGDRYPDLYVSNLTGPNRLYRNRGDGTFVDVGPQLGVTGPMASFPTWFWDYDNDGVLDVYVASYDTGIGHIAAHHLGLPVECSFARVYRGDGQGGFADVTADLGLTYPAMPMGSNYGDLDGDGFLDFYLGTGDTTYYSLMPNLMFLNRGGREFVDVTMAGGFGHVQKGHGIAFADLDNDGDVDVFEQMGGAYTGDGFRDALYENPGFGNRWITIRLVGTESNRSAIGARIRVDVMEGGQPRSIYRHVGSGASFGANPLRQTIGLGEADGIERIEVWWPTTGVSQVVESVGLDRAIRIVEVQSGWTEVGIRASAFKRE